MGSVPAGTLQQVGGGEGGWRGERVNTGGEGGPPRAHPGIVFGPPVVED